MACTVGLLPGDHKSSIDALDTQKQKAEYFLDHVIKPGLEVGYTEQFDKMLNVMETSDDPTVNFVADEIRKFIAVVCIELSRDQFEHVRPPGAQQGATRTGILTTAHKLTL